MAVPSYKILFFHFSFVQRILITAGCDFTCDLLFRFQWIEGGIYFARSLLFLMHFILALLVMV